MTIPGLTLKENFLTEAESKELIEYIDSREWMSALSRRVQHYGFEYGYKHPYKMTELKEPIPEIFLKHMRKLGNKFNQVIVNEYLSGQGIGAHTDHKKHFDDKIVSVSLLSPVVMVFAPEDNKSEKYPVLLKPRSAVILEGDARWNFTHEIPARHRDIFDGKTYYRSRRVSLTFRTYLQAPPAVGLISDCNKILGIFFKKLNIDLQNIQVEDTLVKTLKKYPQILHSIKTKDSVDILYASGLFDDLDKDKIIKVMREKNSQLYIYGKKLLKIIKAVE